MAVDRNRAVWNELYVMKNRAQGAYSMTDGSTAGKAKIVMPLANQDLGYLINGYAYQKAPGGGTTDIDDIFDCTALTDLTAGQYCKVLCLLDDSGTGSIVQGTIKSSAALAPIPDIPQGYSAVGYLTAGGATDWDAVGGLTSEGVGFVEGYPLD